jgi:glycosyltransferase involved in cell wall biosynthesis
MWENKGFEKLAELFHIYDNVIVTNKWLHDELKDFYGDKIKLHNIEHIAKYYTKPSTGSTETFNYGFSGGLWERKKVGVIMEAFDKAKTPNDKLKIHTRKHANTEPMINAFVEEFSKYQTDTNGQIDFINKTMPDDEFTSWWDTLNCYIFISAGESYSVTPRQALMQGTPVILSKNTSHLDLLDVPGILWVECDEKYTAKYSGNADLGAEIGTQFEPRLKDVVKNMKEVRINYSHWKNEAIKGGEIIKKRISKENIAKQWRNVLCK